MLNKSKSKMLVLIVPILIILTFNVNFHTLQTGSNITLSIFSDFGQLISGFLNTLKNILGFNPSTTITTTTSYTTIPYSTTIIPSASSKLSTTTTISANSTTIHSTSSTSTTIPTTTVQSSASAINNTVFTIYIQTYPTMAPSYNKGDICNVTPTGAINVTRNSLVTIVATPSCYFEGTLWKFSGWSYGFWQSASGSGRIFNTKSTISFNVANMTTNLLQANYKKTNIGQCSTYNNETTYFNESIICPSQCPYKSAYYSYYSDGKPVTESVGSFNNLTGFVCLSSPVTEPTSTTSIISTTSTTTIPRTVYYSVDIIQNPDLAGEAGGSVYCGFNHTGNGYIYPFGANLTFVVNNYYPSTIVQNPQPGADFTKGTKITISAPLYCLYNNTSYDFDGWIGKGNGSVTTNASNFTIVVIANITEIANYISTRTTSVSTMSTISTTTIPPTIPTTTTTSTSTTTSITTITTIMPQTTSTLPTTTSASSSITTTVTSIPSTTVTSLPTTTVATTTVPSYTPCSTSTMILVHYYAPFNLNGSTLCPSSCPNIQSFTAPIFSPLGVQTNICVANSFVVPSSYILCIGPINPNESTALGYGNPYGYTDLCWHIT
ncbi:MAG: hypothetical protein QW478_14015 [Candidatus Micrarchaeaceae archaeon]